MQTDFEMYIWSLMKEIQCGMNRYRDIKTKCIKKAYLKIHLVPLLREFQNIQQAWYGEQPNFVNEIIRN